MINNKILINKIILYLISFILFFALIFSININNKFVFADVGFDSQEQEIVEYLDSFYVDIKDDVQNRTAGSVGEKFMANTLATYLGTHYFEKFNGLETYLQEFNISGGTSNNVVGIKNNSASKYVILGAHYDSVYTAGKSYGYSDNMSGVVAATITASRLMDQNKFKVILVFFGAEEIGCVGSNYFAKSLPPEIRDNTLLYINFDSVGAGDYLYYYHTDFTTNYGQKIDEMFRDSELKKYNNELYATNANLGINYTNLGLNSDNSSFIKQAVNSLSFFAGNLETNNGLGYFETANHEKIMHNTDSKETIDEVFGDAFVQNISLVITTTISLLYNSNFNETNFASGQIKTFLYNDWMLKGSGVVLVGLLFGGYFVYNKIKQKKVKIN